MQQVQKKLDASGLNASNAFLTGINCSSPIGKYESCPQSPIAPSLTRHGQLGKRKMPALGPGLEKSKQYFVKYIDNDNKRLIKSVDTSQFVPQQDAGENSY